MARIPALESGRSSDATESLATQFYARGIIVWIVVWILLSVFSLPPDYLPLAAHVLGFGFFAVFATRRIRTLFFIALGGLVLFLIVGKTVPEEYLAAAGNLTGFGAMGITFVVIFCLMRQVTGSSPFTSSDEDDEEACAGASCDAPPLEPAECTACHEDPLTSLAQDKSGECTRLLAESARNTACCDEAYMQRDAVVKEFADALAAKSTLLHETQQALKMAKARVKRVSMAADEETSARLALEKTVASQGEELGMLRAQWRDMSARCAELEKTRRTPVAVPPVPASAPRVQYFDVKAATARAVKEERARAAKEAEQREAQHHAHVDTLEKEVAAAKRHAVALQAKVVEAERRAARKLKASREVADKAVERLKKKLKAAELKAERRKPTVAPAVVAPGPVAMRSQPPEEYSLFAFPPVT